MTNAGLPGVTRSEREPRLRGAVLVFAALAAAFLCMASLGSGLQTEDYAHRAASQGTSRWINLFDLGLDRPGALRADRERGEIPWFTADDFHLKLWRPIASATHHVDYRLWPDNPVAMHLQSVLWLVSSIVAVGFLFRRMESSAFAAGTAVLLYAVDDGHGPAVGWLANRHALVGTTIAVLALILHDHWRRDAWRAGGWLTGLLAWLALQSSELAVGAFAYAAAHIAFLDPAPWRKKWVPLLPWAVSGLVWAVPYRALGYGSRGSGVYVDPVGAPMEFLRALAERWPVLVSAQFSGVSSEHMVHGPPQAKTYAHFLVILFILGVAGWLRRDAILKFWIGGALLAAVATCGTPPTDRLLHIAAIGGTAAVARVIAGAFGALPREPRWWVRFATTVAGLSLALEHGVAAALALPGRSVGSAPFHGFVENLTRTAFFGVTPDQELVLVNAPHAYGASMMFTLQRNAGGSLPLRTRMLYTGEEPVLVHRVAEATLVVVAPQSFVPIGPNRLYRGTSRPMRAGQVLQLSGMRSVIRRVNDTGMPVEVEFEFATPLEDGGRVWKRWAGHHFVPWVPPPVGEKAIVSGMP